MCGYWRQAVSAVHPLLFWFILWLASPLVLFAPSKVLVLMAVLLWCSAIVLAPVKSYGRRLIGAAAIFWFFWFVFIALSTLISHSPIRPALNLAVWISLGLHLMLAKTPLEMALALGSVLSPIFGRGNAAKMALAVALIGRLIPGLLNSAMAIRRSINFRAASLPLTVRLGLWGRCLLRDAFGQSDDLARSIFKRWPR